MPRVRSNVARLKRKKQVMKAAGGAFGARSKLWKAAKENVERGWKYAYRDRKNKKRDFRKLWIIRINTGAHQHGMSYSVFMHGLKKAGIEIDRKILSDLAINDSEAFTALAEKARSALDAAELLARIEKRLCRRESEKTAGRVFLLVRPSGPPEIRYDVTLSEFQQQVTAI